MKVKIGVKLFNRFVGCFFLGNVLLIMPTLTRWLSGPQKKNALPICCVCYPRTPPFFCVCYLNEAEIPSIFRGVNRLIKSLATIHTGYTLFFSCSLSLQFAVGAAGLSRLFFFTSVITRDRTRQPFWPNSFGSVLIGDGGRIRRERERERAPYFFFFR